MRMYIAGSISTFRRKEELVPTFIGRETRRPVNQRQLSIQLDQILCADYSCEVCSFWNATFSDLQKAWATLCDIVGLAVKING